jgi:hypothetical protein
MRTILIATIWLLAPAAQAQSLDQRVFREGVTVSFFTGVEVTDVSSDTWRGTVQRIDDGAVILNMMRGEDYRVYEQGQRQPARVCGRDAVRVVIETERSESIGSYLDERGHVQHLPPTVHPVQIRIALHFEYRGLPFLIMWTVDPARRAHYRALERAFFESIRCA